MIKTVIPIEYLKSLHDLHSDLPSLPEIMKIDKRSKLVCNLYDKKNYVVHIRTLKEALDHRVIQFNQKVWLKTSSGMITELKKHSRNDFEKDFSKLMNNSVFGKTMKM